MEVSKAQEYFFKYFHYLKGLTINALDLEEISFSYQKKKYTFWIVTNFAIDEDGEESIIFAFAPGKTSNDYKRRRFFRKSGSTGVCRAGTGFNNPYIKTARFKKGLDENPGYIFETQVCGILNKKLNEIFEQLKKEKKVCKYKFSKTLFVDKISQNLGTQTPKKSDVIAFFCDETERINNPSPSRNENDTNLIIFHI